MAAGRDTPPAGVLGTFGKLSELHGRKLAEFDAQIVTSYNAAYQVENKKPLTRQRIGSFVAYPARSPSDLGGQMLSGATGGLNRWPASTIVSA